MIRSWTIQMEDGPFLRLQMQGRHDRARPTRLDLPAGRSGFNGRPLPSIALDVLLEAGYAYVLTGESPSMDWDAEAAAPRASPAADEGPTAAGEGRAAEAEPERPPRADTIGPGALPPLTLGEFLFRRDAMAPTRELLIFVPRIPDQLFPPEARSSAVGAAREAGP